MNRICVIGNLTKDPETSTTNNGKSVCNFTVAVNRRQRNQNSDHTEADFFRVATWSGLAEACAKHLTKGKKVCVVGSVSQNTYQGQDGQTRASMNVFAQDVEFLSPRGQAEGGAGNENAAPATPVDVGDELPF